MKKKKEKLRQMKVEEIKKAWKNDLENTEFGDGNELRRTAKKTHGTRLIQNG